MNIKVRPLRIKVHVLCKSWSDKIGWSERLKVNLVWNVWCSMVSTSRIMLKSVIEHSELIMISMENKEIILLDNERMYLINLEILNTKIDKWWLKVG